MPPPPKVDAFEFCFVLFCFVFEEERFSWLMVLEVPVHDQVTHGFGSLVTSTF